MIKKTLEARHWKQDIGSKTWEARHWKQDIGSKTLEARHWKHDGRFENWISKSYFLQIISDNLIHTRWQIAMNEGWHHVASWIERLVMEQYCWKNIYHSSQQLSNYQVTNTIAIFKRTTWRQWFEMVWGKSYDNIKVMDNLLWSSQTLEATTCCSMKEILTNTLFS